MSTTTDRLSALRTRVTRIVREATGLHERMAFPIADEIVHALERELVVVPPPAPPVLSREARDTAIIADVARGHSVHVICRRYGVSRATVYRVYGREHGG